MTAVLLATSIILGTTTLYCLCGWWSASRRIDFLEAVVEAAKTEIWSEGG